MALLRRLLRTVVKVEPDWLHGRFAELRPVLLRDEDFAYWYAAGTGRPSVPPSLVAGAFLLALREGCSDREAEQRMRFDLRWKWALGLGVGRPRLPPHHHLNRGGFCRDSEVLR
jgi:hypothetical protein